MCVCGGVHCCVVVFFIFFFQAEDGIRYLVRSRGLGDVYKRQPLGMSLPGAADVAGNLRPKRSRQYQGT